MQKRILLTYFFMLSLPIATFAALRPVITLSPSATSANVYSSSVIDFSPFQNSYVGSSHYDSEFDLGIFIGTETPFLQLWAWQIGLSYFQNSPFFENGNVYQFSDPAYNNLTYQYQVLSRRVSVDTKISRTIQTVCHPYVSASAGEAFNRAYQYTEYPVTSADVPMAQAFGSHTTNSFTYSVGLGMDVDISEHWRVGAGYRFLDLGKASLGVTPLESGNGVISTSHIHANEYLAQITYIG